MRHGNDDRCVDLSVIEDMLRSATPGPWRIESDSHDGTRWLVVRDPPDDPDVIDVAARCHADDDATLVIALRNSASSMIAEIKALRAVADAARSYRDARRGVDAAWTMLNKQLSACDAHGGPCLPECGTGEDAMRDADAKQDKAIVDLYASLDDLNKISP